MLTPSAKPANRFRISVKRGVALCLGGLSVLCPPMTGVFAAADGPATDGNHKVGLADSRVGYESASYVTDSKVVIQTLGERQPLNELSVNPPLGLPEVTAQLDPAEIDLGRQLFFDRRLSKNETLSCAMCHIPEQGFTQNELATPVGHLGKGVRGMCHHSITWLIPKRFFLMGGRSLLRRRSGRHCLLRMKWRTSPGTQCWQNWPRTAFTERGLQKRLMRESPRGR